MERLHKALGKSELRASRPTIDVSLSESSGCSNSFRWNASAHGLCDNLGEPELAPSGQRIKMN